MTSMIFRTDEIQSPTCKTRLTVYSNNEWCPKRIKVNINVIGKYLTGIAIFAYIFKNLPD